MPSSTSAPSDTPEGYIFTGSQDWFTHNIPHWKSLFPHISTDWYPSHNKGARILEIGSWEGRSAVFLCGELLKAPESANDPSAGEIVCVDHVDSLNTAEGRERYRRLQHNLGLTGKAFRIIPEFSFTALTKLLNEAVAADGLPDSDSKRRQGFDWVYVDGSHRSDDTLLDGEMAWRLTRKGGLMIFDDYLWNVEPETSIHHPRRGIDAFLALHHGEYERLSARRGVEGEGDEYQVVLKKTVDMRIGYLLPPGESLSNSLASRVDPAAFDYAINIGVTADSSFAMPLGVLLSSLLEHTPGRISIYVLDCGLTGIDRKHIESIVAHRPDVTLSILSPPTQCLNTELGSAVWAKIDLAVMAPVERLLYLDADILIRGDIRPLWDTALEGCTIGAAVDIGYPLGHSGLPSWTTGAKYFNAGVLLMDLTKMRVGSVIETLKAKCRDLKEARFADQDALNVHFAADWKEVSLKWNAQGLGTYAAADAPGRHWVDQGAIANPRVVHFNGPVHPPLDIVLNPFVQPYTAKPWGYAGSPGHPFAEEWFDVLRNTPFQEYFNGEWRTICEEEKRKKADEANRHFDRVVEAANVRRM